MNVLAVSTLPYLNLTLTEALKRIEALGLRGVEIYFEGKHNLSKKEITDVLSIFDLKLFLHAPFSDLNLASFNKTVLEESKRQIKRSLEIAAEIGAITSTVHFGRYSPLGLSYPDKALLRNLESLREINSFAADIGADVAFENSPCGFGAMYGPLDLIEHLTGESEVKITLDVGHANTWEEEVVEDFIYRLNSNIAHVHLHDNSGEDDNHLVIGEGAIDYKRVFDAFKDINYQNALCLELLNEDDLRKSLRKTRELLNL
jgi:sugar phosphate isomerase/epimerase